MSTGDPNDPRPSPPAFYRFAQRFEAPVAGLMGMTCREFAQLTVARMDRPLNRGEALRHRLHGTMCGICRRFSAQFALMDALLREEEAYGQGLPDDEALGRIEAVVREKTGRPRE